MRQSYLQYLNKISWIVIILDTPSWWNMAVGALFFQVADGKN